MAHTGCYQCLGCDRVILAGSALLDHSENGFPFVQVVNEKQRPDAKGPRYVLERVCKRCRQKVNHFCTGCCRTWPQSDTVSYHVHLQQCNAMAEDAGNEADGPDDEAPEDAVIEDQEMGQHATGSASSGVVLQHSQGRDAKLSKERPAVRAERLVPFVVCHTPLPPAAS